jgi:hypothetical protein
VLCAAASLVNYAEQTKIAWDSFIYFNRVDDVSRWVNRLAPLRAKIPPSVDRVGYVSEDPQYNEFYLTQYAIIPLVLERGQGPEWMIANDSDRNARRLLNGEVLDYDTENFGFGLYLIHRK